tara:strand:+ start:205 stop:1506 length:1302 start_codon:yes stop_codon:yes gene_type:complete
MTYIIKDLDAVEFDYDLQSHSQSITDFIQDVTKQAGLTRLKQKNTAKLIFLNFLMAQGNAVYVSFDNNFQVNSQGNPLSAGVTTLRTTVQRLMSAGLIAKVGGKNLPYGNGISTTIRPSPDLYERLNNLNVLFEFPQSVILRRSLGKKKKISIDYLDTMRSDSIKHELQRYSSLLATTKIEIRDSAGGKVLEPLLSTHLRRMFIDNGEVNSVGHPRFNSGGRSYAPWTSLSPAQRSNIWIDGEATVEEDYEASYVNVMYMAATGARYVGDPYQISIEGTAIPRHIVKAVASMAVNNTSKLSVYKAYCADYATLKRSTDPKKVARYTDYQQYNLKEQVDPVLEKFLAMHQSIAHLYLQGVSLGNKVQCLESDLVFSIVDKLTRADIPCLTVHDSIIVQKKYQGLVKLLMNTTTFPDPDLLGGWFKKDKRKQNLL